MKITVESTDLVVELEIGGAKVPARVWRGVTSEGVPCMAFVTRIAPVENTDEAAAAFERELVHCGVSEVPGLSRMVLAMARTVEDPE